MDPQVSVRPIEGQVDDLLGEIRVRAEKNERVLVTTLTTRMAEDLTEYLTKNNIKARYIHHEVDTMERMEIIRDLRMGVFDALVGINLLREGLDIPEVSLVAILDADKEGFLRNTRSLIQTIGRAARNADGQVIMYADTITRSMKKAIDETNRRRTIQSRYNEEHHIVPQTIRKDIQDVIQIAAKDDNSKNMSQKRQKLTKEQREKLIAKLTAQMKDAASKLEFEVAASLRDEIQKITREGWSK